MGEPQREEYVDEIDLFEYVRIFWKRKWSGLLIINCVVIATLVYTLWIADDVYEAQAAIMPLKSSSGGTMSVLRSIVPGGLTQLPLSEVEEDLNRFINILRSRTIAEAVVRHLDLINQLYSDILPEERPMFQEAVRIVRGSLVQVADNKQGLVYFTARAPSSQLAADIANAYVQHLQQYLKENTTTESRRTRIFIEEQYQKAFHHLDTAEQKLQTFQETHKVVSLPEQTEDMIKRLGALNADLKLKAVDLNVRKRIGVSENNPEYKRLIYEIDEIRQLIAELEKGTANSSEFDSVVLEALPELQKQLAQLMRDRTMQETLHMLLAQELKQAEIAEESDEISFLTLDSAIPPLWRVRPNRRLSLLLGGTLGVMFAIVYIMLRTFWEKHRNLHGKEILHS